MSRKTYLPPYKTLSSGDLSQATLTSSVTNIQSYDDVAVQINCTTSSAIGTFAVLGSIDNQNFVSIDLPEAPTVDGTDKQILIDLSNLSFSYIKTTYTKTSGTGTVDVWVSGKGK